MIRGSISSIPTSESRAALARRVDFDNPPLKGSWDESIWIHLGACRRPRTYRKSWIQTDSHRIRLNPGSM